MSSLTNFLKLFKWDTKTDGSEKFDIDKALNENIDKIEANAVAVNETLASKMNLYKITKSLSKKGWYRVAQFNETGNYIVNIIQKYNNSVPSNFLLSINIATNKFNISILDCSDNDSSNLLGISQVRIVRDTNSITAPTFLEIYYNYAVPNTIKVQILNDTSQFILIDFTETTDENIFVKATKTMKILHLDDAIGTLSSLTTTDKTSLVNALNEVNNKKINITTGTEYATNEYIDNKQVYRKRINFGALPNATTKNVAHRLSNVTFIRMQGIATDGSTTISLPFSHISSSAQCVQLSITSENVVIETKTDRSGFNNAYVDLYYTKNS